MNKTHPPGEPGRISPPASSTSSASQKALLALFSHAERATALTAVYRQFGLAENDALRAADADLASAPGPIALAA